MSTTELVNHSTRTSPRGRTVSQKSFDLSRSITKRFLSGQTQPQIMNTLNNNPQRKKTGKTMTIQAVSDRITKFRERFPKEYKAVEREVAAEAKAREAAKAAKKNGAAVAA